MSLVAPKSSYSRRLTAVICHDYGPYSRWISRIAVI